MNISATEQKQNQKAVKDYSTRNGELAKKLYEISQKSGRSQKEIAWDASMMPIELSQCFHGRKIMYIDDAERIAKCLGYRIELVKEGER